MDDHEMAHETKLSLVTGTPHFMSPQVLEKAYDEKCDMWALGSTLYNLLFGTKPFGIPPEFQDMGYCQRRNELEKAIKKGDFEIPKIPEVSEEAKDLIRQMLEMDADKRCSAGEALNHKWFGSIVK
eukprot:Trichotokara_eunicae@DN7027_c0_g1_i1.p1